MKERVSIRLLKPWRRFKKGHIFSPYGMLRSDLIRRGFAEVVELETAVVGPDECAALHVEPPKRKRGRPRKHPLPES